MAITIKFDKENNVIQPTLVLATRSDRKLGVIPAYSINVSDNFNSNFELTFSVSKFDNGKKWEYWDELRSFRLIWCREWDVWFEADVKIREDCSVIKDVTCRSICEAETSQTNLYNVEINTEIDISRDDYSPTVLFNEENHNASLLHRIIEKMPHYTIGHVDSSIANIQRTFSFNGRSIYDSLQEVAEEIDCIFVFDSGTADDGSIKREINAYDLEYYCADCGERQPYMKVCPNCGSSNIRHGYGDDTSIYVSAENIAEYVELTTDTPSVKNCFRLEAGDDLMTATVANCNPNGSRYIWYITDYMLDDMTNELSTKLSQYNDMYDYYQNEYVVNISDEAVSAYNSLVDKYSSFTDEFAPIDGSVTGYPGLMNLYYDTIDFYLFLNDTLMPSPEIDDTTAAKEAAKLTVSEMSPVAVANLSSASATTVTASVLAMAKIVVSKIYQVKVASGTYADGVWTGNFVITSYSDEEDTATSAVISINITDNYEEYIKQLLHKRINSSMTDDLVSVSNIFDLDIDEFKDALKNYGLKYLQIFESGCRACIDMLIEQGIADNKTWADKDPNMYDEVYTPYYNKLIAIQEEVSLREEEIGVITGTDTSVQTYLDSERDIIKDALNIETYLGDELWNEFLAYRREDTYSNPNYISDGLDNTALFRRAGEFLDVAKKEIFKSATMQHSISASLSNLLTIKEFEPIVEYFCVGNWIRVKIDDIVYRLRLISYSISFDDLSNISIEFSDTEKFVDGMSDTKSVLDQAASMASSYDAVTRQASQGKRSNSILDNWVENGLSLTNVKIVSNPVNQNITYDDTGLLCREYLPLTDTYSDKQLKIINKGLYVTNDNWKTSTAGIGEFTFYNPMSGEYENAYGVIAQTLVGNLILGENVGVYNEEGSVSLTRSGLTITANATGDTPNSMAFNIQKKLLDENDNEYVQQVAYFDTNGEFILTGNVRFNSGHADDSLTTLDEMFSVERYSTYIDSVVEESTSEIVETFNSKYDALSDSVNETISDYKAEVGQYLTFGGDGLTIGATGSAFKTVIDNSGMYFKQDGNTVAYVNNNQLYIPNAVVQNILSIGNFAFIPRSNGSFSLDWTGD